MDTAAAAAAAAVTGGDMTWGRRNVAGVTRMLSSYRGRIRIIQRKGVMFDDDGAAPIGKRRGSLFIR